MIDHKHLRNFSIIAHIDHGKSTLSDRLLESAGLIGRNQANQQQILDSLEVEKNHGITVKAHTVSVRYQAENGEVYRLNFIDTPGHVDFSYEVSRSLKATEGVLLLVDASQGIQAQTVSNFFLALEHDLEIIPVINKIDLPSAHVDMVKEQLDRDFGLDPEDAVAVSAKTGEGVDLILKRIVEKIPEPEGDPKAPLKALVYDAYYDVYRGVVVKVRVIDGTLKAKERIRFMLSKKESDVEEVGIISIELIEQQELSSGEVGYIIAGIKSITEFGVGDTVTHAERPCDQPLEGYQPPKQFVFAGLFPIKTEDFESLHEALLKLKMNDASLTLEKWNSGALGMGFKCGFLGLLHLEIVQERLDKEFQLNIISTVPSVEYRITLNDDTSYFIENANELPDISSIQMIEEPYVSASIILPNDFLGPILTLIQERRGIQKNMSYIDTNRVEVHAELPLSEIIYDFYDKLKSYSKGYASFDYSFLDFRKSDIIKMDILVNGRPVDALSQMVHREKAYQHGRGVTDKLAETIPQHMFVIAIQAAIGGKVIARSTVRALRKDVTAKCYGGDITRKRKLLEKQKAGKKKMKMIGDVNIPQEAFLSVLKRGDNE